MKATMARTLAMLLALLASGAARGQTPGCDKLSEKDRAVAKAAMERAHLYDCCDDTIARCLAASPRCPLATRLAEDVCRRAGQGEDAKAIEKALGKRAQSMVPLGAPAKSELDEATRAGDAAAKVVVVVYACSRCPFCKELIPALHREVVSGALKGKVRLYLRPFPLKSHEHSTEADLAALAAARLGRFWPYLLMLYERFDKLDPKLLGDWAVEAGMDRAAFDKAYADPALRDALAESKKEGLRNKVAATPAVFVDGRPYLYDLQLAPLVDVLQEAAEKL